jgi:phosphoglycerate dehydrogenase-like enzyme
LRIGFCVRGFTGILKILRELLPEDEVFECDQSELAMLAPTADVLIPTICPIPASIFAGGRLKLIQQYGVGLDSIDIQTATTVGVPVCNVPSVGTGNAESVAELAIAHLLMLSRDIPDAVRQFKLKKVGAPLGRCLWGSTVCIVGYGGVGEEIARRLQGFGVRIVAVSKTGPNGSRARDSTIRIDLHVDQSSLLDAVAEADFVIVGAPATTENRGLVGWSVLSSMKSTAYIVNVARGPVIDYKALKKSLEEGKIAGAGLDVFWNEPFDPHDPIFRKNVIATPHIGGSTERSLLGIGRAVACNIDRLRNGETLMDCANPGAISGGI